MWGALKKTAGRIRKLWEKAKNAFDLQYAKEGPFGKVTLLLLPVLASFYLLPRVLRFIHLLVSGISGEIATVLAFVLGWQAGQFTRSFPAFPMTLFYGGLIALGYWKSGYLGSELNPDIVTAAEILLFGALTRTVLSYLFTKNPKSPFLVGRIYDALPDSRKPFADIVGILIGTAVLVFAVLKWDEVPKFVFNYLERASYADMLLIQKQSDDVEALIERKRNQDLTIAERNTITTTYMDLLGKQQQTMDDLDGIFRQQSSVPFLPAAFNGYLDLKKQWFQTHKVWFTAFHTVKKLEREQSDLLQRIVDAEGKVRSIDTIPPQDVLKQLDQAVAAAKEVQKSLELLRKDRLLTEDMEDYLAIRAKKVIDISALISGHLDETPVTPETIDAIQEIGSRGKDMDYETVYIGWRKAVLDPIDAVKANALDSIGAQFNAVLDRHDDPTLLHDDITPVVLRYRLLPAETLPDANADPLPFLPTELAAYYRVYENPVVIFLRKAFTAYLTNAMPSAYIDQDAMTAVTEQKFINGLDAFDASYFRSKFVVLTIVDDESDGKLMKILFQDKPDHIFTVWIIGKLGSFRLHAISTRKKEDPKYMDYVLKKYKPYIEDRIHAM